MGVSKIKKNQMPQVDPDTIPGYNAPPTIAAQPGAQMAQTPRRSASEAMNFPAQGRPAQQQPMGYDLQPIRQARPVQYEWLSLHFKTQDAEQIGSWLTEIEQATGVIGLSMAYAPGGVIVAVKTRAS